MGIEGNDVVRDRKRGQNGTLRKWSPEKSHSPKTKEDTHDRDVRKRNGEGRCNEDKPQLAKPLSYQDNRVKKLN